MNRTVELRYRILRNGVNYGELYPREGSAPTLRMNDDGEIKMSLTGSFAEPEDIDWLTDEIQLELWIDGTPYPLGVYLPTAVEEADESSIKSYAVEAYDRCWLLRDTRVEEMPYFPTGTAYLTAVRQLLTAAGIGMVLETPSFAVLAEDREDWAIGTSYLQIINDLLEEINYKSVWFNAQGVAVLEPVSIPTAENIQHTLDDQNVKSLLLPSFSRKTDIYAAPNVWICVCSNPDKSGDMVATAVNDNVLSPLSVQRRGRRISQVVKVRNIASQEELQAYADRLKTESQFTGETVRVETALLPGFGVSDVTALRYGSFLGICVERSWTMELRVGGTMTHVLEKVVPNLG